MKAYGYVVTCGRNNDRYMRNFNTIPAAIKYAGNIVMSFALRGKKITVIVWDGESGNTGTPKKIVKLGVI